MSDYSKLVKALRCNALSKQCDSCKYGYHLCPDSECNDACKVEQVYADAAAAIEDMSAQLADKDYLIQQQMYEIQRLMADVKRQQEKMFELAKKLPKRGERTINPYESTWAIENGYI